MAINPRGLIPALQHGDWGCYESTVLMEYVSLPLDPWHRTKKCAVRACSKGLLLTPS